LLGLHFIVQPWVAHRLRHAKGGAFELEFVFAPLFMPKKLKRYYGKGDPHFITCTCYRRLALLRWARSRSVFVKILGAVRDRYGFQLVGYVVMPNHIHLLISETGKGTPSTVMRVLKQRVSRRLHEKRGRQSGTQLGLPFQGGGSSLPQFWQRRFHDFNVWNHKKKIEKLRYMHFNPVMRKLVRDPKDWPWSSYSHYGLRQEGLVRIDGVA
jgi:putative transposase